MIRKCSFHPRLSNRVFRWKRVYEVPVCCPNNTSKTSKTDNDDDNDGLLDWFEVNDGNDLTGQFDADNDGLDDNEDADDDNDGILDIYEF